MTEPTGVVFLNGRFLPASRARISVYDRGLMFGDGLFETLRSYCGWPFGLAEHLQRLGVSAGILGIPLPDYDWPRILAHLLRRNRLQGTDAALRLVVTRGVSGPSLQPPPKPRPTCIITARRVDPTVARMQRQGIVVTLLPFGRHGCMAEHKILDYVPAILGRALAVQRGCSDGLYFDGTRLREGTTASLFLIRGDSLLTPPLDGILPSITRRVVLDIAAARDLKVVERDLSAQALLRSDEAFLCSSVAELVPVVALDREPIGGGSPGRITRLLQKDYRRAVRDARTRATEVSPA